MKKSLILPVENKIRLSYNDECCFNCLKKDKLVAVNDDGSLVHCTRCNLMSKIFEYVNKIDKIKKTHPKPVILSSDI